MLKNFYDSLTPEQQTIMQESADNIAYMANQWQKMKQQEMAKTGLVFVEPSEFKTK